MPLRIGLTGGIGSGKSTVAAMLTARGATLVDTDAISRRLTSAGGAAMPALAETFGKTMVSPDGALDREAMRALVFTDSQAKRRLEALLHPRIGAEAMREAGTATGQAVVFDVPLLVESSQWRNRVDRVLVVDCRPVTQVERVALRPGWTVELAQRVISSQISRSARAAAADAVIYNDAITLVALDAAVGIVWREWVTLARGPMEQ